MSDRITLCCWKCGEQLQNLMLPFSRMEECSACSADLHSCLGCNNYANHLSNSCNEDRADFVSEKEKSNFCDFFSPNPTASVSRDNSETKLAKAKLAELFGETPNLEDLSEALNEPDPSDNSLSEADKALAELNRLFSKD